MFCQRPIVGLDTEYEPHDTVQLDEWRYSDQMYVRVDEVIDLTITTSDGDPIYYTIDKKSMDDAADIQKENQTGITAAGAPTPSTKTFQISYDDHGVYTVNVTAWNLHSEEVYGAVKYSHNASKVDGSLL